MNISIQLIVLLTVFYSTNATFHKLFKNHKKNRNGLFGGYFDQFDITNAFDSLVRYAPDFSDIIPKVKNKIFGPRKHHKHRPNNDYDDYIDEHNYGYNGGGGGVKHKKQGHRLGYPGGYGGYPGGYGGGYGGYGSYPLGYGGGHNLGFGGPESFHLDSGFYNHGLHGGFPDPIFNDVSVSHLSTPSFGYGHTLNHLDHDQFNFL